MEEQLFIEKQRTSNFQEYLLWYLLGVGGGLKGFTGVISPVRIGHISYHQSAVLEDFLVLHDISLEHVNLQQHTKKQ